MSAPRVRVGIAAIFRQPSSVQCEWCEQTILKGHHAVRLKNATGVSILVHAICAYIDWREIGLEAQPAELLPLVTRGKQLVEDQSKEMVE